MSANCPTCGQPMPEGSVQGDAHALAPGEETAILADMLRNAGRAEESEAVPYEALQAEPGMALALDEQGEPLQTTVEEVMARGLRPIPPGGAPALPPADGKSMAQALRRSPRR